MIIKINGKMHIIDNDTRAIICMTLAGNYVLILYNNKSELYRKEYKTYKGACIAQAHFMRKYNL